MSAGSADKERKGKDFSSLPTFVRDVAVEVVSLDEALVQHSVGDLEEAGNVGAVDEVPWSAKALGSFEAALVYLHHYVVQLFVDFFAGPAQSLAVLRHFEA
jgi:hypothetical protein